MDGWMNQSADEKTTKRKSPQNLLADVFLLSIVRLQKYLSVLSALVIDVVFSAENDGVINHRFPSDWIEPLDDEGSKQISNYGEEEEENLNRMT